MAVNPGRKIRGKGEKNKMDMVTDVGSNRIFRAPGETGRQQPQRWFNAADITVAHQSNLLKQLEQQRRREQFCDCSVLVEGQLFRAHRNVLFASSGYFRMLLSQSAEGPCDVASATFDAFSPDTFTVILDFIYSGQLELTSLNVIEVMSAASYLQMNSVIKYCKNFITSSLDISIKEEESDRAIMLPEVCSFPRGDGREALSEQEQEQEQAPCSLSPPPALWTTQDSVCTQTGFTVKSPEQEHLTLKTSPSSPAVEANTELEEIQDPSDPLFTLPGPERRRGRAAAAAAVRRRMPYCTRSSTQQDSLEVQEARAQKAERAEELYASLPAFVGLIGHFSKDANPTMRFKCPFCTHTVKRKADLKRHLRCHTGERPYPCQACNKRFTRLEHLRSHFETIHQARKLVCRKCKCSVTEETGHVVCEGTRRYRMCSQCIQEVGCENEPLGTTDRTSQEPALLLGVDGEEQEGERSWVVNGDDQEDEDDLAEDSGTDLIIQEVDDSDEEMQ